MPAPVTFAGSPASLSAPEITPEERAAGACLPRPDSTTERDSHGAVAVEQLVRRFKTVERLPESSSAAQLVAAKHCLPELVTASLTCAATSAAAAPTLGASLVAASVCIGAGAAAGRCLANQVAASELRALERAGAELCVDEGGLPLAAQGNTTVCLMP